MDKHLTELPKPRASFWEWISRLSELITIVKFAYGAWKWTRRRNVRLPAFKLHPVIVIIVVSCLVAGLATSLSPSTIATTPAPLISSETHSTETFLARASTSGTLHTTDFPSWAAIVTFVVITAGVFVKGLAPSAFQRARHRRKLGKPFPHNANWTPPIDPP
jgi:hypothetical protein